MWGMEVTLVLWDPMAQGAPEGALGLSNTVFRGMEVTLRLGDPVVWEMEVAFGLGDPIV